MFCVVTDVTTFLPPAYQRPLRHESLSILKKGTLFASCVGTGRHALLFSLFCGLVLCLPDDARAASWDWSRRGGRERVIIRLDTPGEHSQTVRDAQQSLAVRLERLPQSLEARQTPPQNSLIRDVRIDPATMSLRVDTNTPAFGFIVTTPGNGSIVLDMFPDALGARWRPDGTIAPVSAPVIPVPQELAQTSSATPPPRASGQAAVSVPQTPPTQQTAQDSSSDSSVPGRQNSPAEAVGQPKSETESTVLSTEGQAPSLQPASISSSVSSSSPAAIPSHEQPLSVPAATPEEKRQPDIRATQQPSPSPAETSVTASSPQQPVSRPVSADATAAHGQSSIPSAGVSSSAPAQPETVMPSQAAHAQGSQISITVNTGQSVPPSPTAVAAHVPPSTPQNAAPSSPVTPSQPAPSSPSRSGYELSHTVSAAGEPLVSARMNMGGPETWPSQSSPDVGTTPPPGGQGNINITVSVPSGGESRTDPAFPSPEDTASVQGSATDTSPQQTATADAASSSISPVEGAPSPQEPQVLSTTSSIPEQDKQKKESEDVSSEQQKSPDPIYVDEEGNPVPPPPDIPTLLKDADAKMERGEYASALPDLETLKQAELSPEERENVLYNYMKSLYEKYHPDFGEHAEEVIDAANAAMNFNLDSYRVPEALSTLASVNLAAGNIEDAKGYVYLMRRKYHGNPQVPSSLLNLGREYMRRQDYADASIAFSQILEEYPESKNAKDAGLLQVHSLYRQGHYDRALTLIEFVDRRWPRIYLEDEEYLPVSADVALRQGKYDKALETYWKQYNLHPSDATTPGVLMHIGELYYRTNRPLPAGKALEELVRAFPESAEAPRALLLLGENGIHDGNPELDEVLAIFEKPNPRIPSIFYQRISRDYPNAPEAISARLRTIAWQYRNKEYVPAMDAARGFMIDYEDKPESLRAKDILLRAFAVELSNSLSEENYERVLSLWERYPQVQPYYQPLEPDLRVALARGQLNRGNEAAGLELLAPFLETHENPEYGLYAYNLYLSSYLRSQNWDGILSLGDKVHDWKLPPEARHQLDYAMALSAENLNLPGRALPLWKTLAPLSDIPLYQRAYANYFLARDAERRQDLRDAYQYNLDTLGMFTQLQDEQSPYADSERVRESIAALMDVTEIAGRYAEALDWAAKYAAFVPATSPDYAGLRFREARLHRKMGDTARWRAILQGIVDNEPDSVFGKMAASELHTSNVARDLSRFTENN